MSEIALLICLFCTNLYASSIFRAHSVGCILQALSVLLIFLKPCIQIRSSIAFVLHGFCFFESTLYILDDNLKIIVFFKFVNCQISRLKFVHLCTWDVLFNELLRTAAPSDWSSFPFQKQNNRFYDQEK